jgi:hypothetical protein
VKKRIGGIAAAVIVVGVVVYLLLAFWKPADVDWDRVSEAALAVFAALLIALFVATVWSVWRHFGAMVSVRGAVLVMAYETVWAFLLAVLAVDYIRQEPVEIVRMIGSVPTPVLWFGALGGVLISLAAVGERSSNGSWDDRWALWRLLRPLVGVAVGVIAVLIVQGGILAIGSDPTPGKSGLWGPNFVTYYLVAFLVAYRESTFRELIKRLADTVLSTSTGRPAIDTVVPDHGPEGAAIAITGSGLAGTTTVQFGQASAAPMSKTAAYLVVTAPPKADATGSAAAGPAPGPAAVPVIVQTSEGAAASNFTYD